MRKSLTKKGIVKALIIVFVVIMLIICIYYALTRRTSGKKIQIETSDGRVYQVMLYDNKTANQLYDQLPLTLEVNDMSGYKEKYGTLPMESLDTGIFIGDMPLYPEIGYYEPMNIFCMYYGFIGWWPGKVPIGKIDATNDDIKAMQAGSTITITAIE